MTGQFAAIDERISGKDNLVLVGRLLGANSTQARTRAQELLELFDLTGSSKRPVRTYSGGMRRRLDLAASLVGRPEVIFLDEPTTGLDPTSRQTMWQVVRDLAQDGGTVVLTTQYLEEADRLADWIAVLRDGHVVASGVPADLKVQVGTRTLTVRLTDLDDVSRASSALRRAGLQPVSHMLDRTLTVPVAASRDVAIVVRALDDVSVEADELALSEPGLDEVYRVFTERARAIAD